MAKKTIYDFVVIGGGLSGLITANILKRNGYTVQLLEESSEIGGCLNSNEMAVPLDRGLKIFVDNPQTHSALEFLSVVLNKDISITIKELPTTTFEKGSFVPFVGFGSRAPAYADEIEFYTSTQRVFLNITPTEWVEQLRSEIEEETQILAKVTEFKTENGRVSGLTVNGSKEILANNFIFTAPPTSLKESLGDHLSPRAVQKISKGPFWSTVSIDIIHSGEITDNEGVFILMGGTDDAEPCLGHFLPATTLGEKSVQASQWTVFLSQEEDEDDETSGLKLREIKKQIKRAFPDALDDVHSERILHSNNSHGTVDIKLTDRMTLPGLENLYIQSGHFSQERNLVGVLDQAQRMSEILDLNTEARSEEAVANEATEPSSSPHEGAPLAEI